MYFVQKKNEWEHWYPFSMNGWVNTNSHLWTQFISFFSLFFFFLPVLLLYFHHVFNNGLYSIWIHIREKKWRRFWQIVWYIAFCILIFLIFISIFYDWRTKKKFTFFKFFFQTSSMLCFFSLKWLLNWYFHILYFLSSLWFTIHMLTMMMVMQRIR